MPKIISRKEAIEQGLTNYFTGKPCKNGHLRERKTKSGLCPGCANIYQKKYRQSEKGKRAVAKFNKKFQQSEKGKLYHKELRETEEGKLYQRTYRQSEEGKRAHAKYQQSEKGKIVKVRVDKKYRKENQSAMNSYTAKYKATQKKATTSWANLEKIKEIYKNCPKGYEVDHIMPIQSEIATGLHVETNLQYLTKSKNASKSNKISKEELRKLEIAQTEDGNNFLNKKSS